MLKKRMLSLLIAAIVLTGLLSAVFAEEIATTETISIELTESTQDLTETPAETQNDVTENAQVNEVPSKEPETTPVRAEEKDAETVATAEPIEEKAEIVVEEVKEVTKKTETPAETKPVEEKPEVIVTEETKTEETKTEENPIEEVKNEENPIEEITPEATEPQNVETVTEEIEIAETEEVIIEELPSEEGPIAAETTETPAAETDETSSSEVAEEPEDAENDDEEVKFSGKAFISIQNNGIIYYGDSVVLKANVENANMDYSIVWETSEDGLKWERVGTGESYAFILTAENASRQYRIILNSK